MFISIKMKPQVKWKISFPFFWIITNIMGFFSLYHFPTNWIINFFRNQLTSEFLFLNSISFLFSSFLFAICQFPFLYFFLQKKLALRWFLITWIALFLTYIVSMLFLSLVFAKIIFPLFFDMLIGFSYYYRFFIGVQASVAGSAFVKLLVIIFLSIYYSIGIGPLIGFLQGSLFLDKQSSKRWMMNVTISILLGLTFNSILLSFIPKMNDFKIVFPLVFGIVYSISTFRTLNNFGRTTKIS